MKRAWRMIKKMKTALVKLRSVRILDSGQDGMIIFGHSKPKTHIMFENLSLGLDIATALSVIAAAAAFIWNSVLSHRKDRNDRRREVIRSYAFKVADKVYEDIKAIMEETDRIRDRLQEGQTTQNLNPWRDLIFNLRYTLVPIETIDEVYGDGRFIRLSAELQGELQTFMSDFFKLISPASDEKWDFDEVMGRPYMLAKKYHIKLFQETEDYFEGL